MPNPLRTVSGVAAALPTHNLDTDVIMPKRFLRTVDRTGLAAGVLADLRSEPSYVLNHAPWNTASILVVGDNFGCGSSREHAVWGLHQLGIRAIIGTGFAGIFADNCRRNALATITVTPVERDLLLALAQDAATSYFTVDLVAQKIHAADTVMVFVLPPAVRDDLLAGRDAIGVTLEHEAAISAFECRLA